jgi:hypothetical protein
MTRVFYRVRKHRHAVQAAASGQNTTRAHPARRGFEAHQFVETCGNAPRTRRVRPQSKGDAASSHGHRRARAGAPADMAVTEYAVGDAIGGARTHQTRGKLIQIGFPQPHRTGRLQPLDHCGMLLGGLHRAATRGRGGNTRNVDVVLHREGHAEKRVSLQQRVSVGETGSDRIEPRQLQLKLLVAHRVYPRRWLQGRTALAR